MNGHQPRFSQFEIYLDLCVWALPLAIRWTFTDNYNSISLHLLCFEIKASWA